MEALEVGAIGNKVQLGPGHTLAEEAVDREAGWQGDRVGQVVFGALAVDDARIDARPVHAEAAVLLAQQAILDLNMGRTAVAHIGDTARLGSPADGQTAAR